MSDDDLTSITFRPSPELREKIKAQAAAEQRSVSGFIRFHLGEILKTSDDDAAEQKEQEGGDQ